MKPLDWLRDNVHSHLCHAKRPFRSGQIFQQFEGPVFDVENMNAWMPGTMSVSLLGLVNNGRVDRNIKNENDMEYVLWNLKRKKEIHTFR